ncbi:helix-turn-helix domain-containing protein [Paenibacillus agaridevorans]|uniref:helix-turn-helix domain-containing protein n=1 Tax=Paenibacillus agaridevorans TaxID=171404 RepID=UPI003CCE57EB
MQDLYELLPLGRNSIYKLVNEKGFPKIRVGRRIIIPAKKFKEWTEARVEVQ